MGCEKVIKPRCKVPKTDTAQPGSTKWRSRTICCIKTLQPGVKIQSVARSGCDRIEGDFVAQPFQTPDKTTLDGLAIPLIEVVPA